MPAMVDDPTKMTIYRSSGPGPYPTAKNPQIPSSIFPRPVTLRDRVTIATLVPFFSPGQVPSRLLSYLCDQLNKEIEGGDTYPMTSLLPYDAFGPYWFGNFAAVMLLGDVGGIESVESMESNGRDWSKICLGSFYVKPNYPGRSSHICNGGFLVTPAARNKGVGKSMGECYLDWAPLLGYTYSVFNLVYESNTASTRIWDSLGFKRIGRIPACGNLRSSTELVDAIIYGRDLGPDGENFGSEERFDKIRYYLKHSNYPTGADRAEKSRLRSAATHYKIVGGEDGEAERLMLKGKEVISDPQSQYEIAREAHTQSHGGINKTTAMIATKYHWVRIKEMVSLVIKNCVECKEAGKTQFHRPDSATRSDLPKMAALEPSALSSTVKIGSQQAQEMATGERYVGQGSHMLPGQDFDHKGDPFSSHDQPELHNPVSGIEDYQDMAIDPQIMHQLQSQMDPQYPHPGDAYETTEMADFSDASQMHHHHHAHSAEYQVDESDDQLIAQVAAAASMDLVDETHLDHEEHLPQHLLQGGYVDPDGTTHFDQ